MAALKDWRTRGAPVENGSDGDSASVSDSNSDCPDGGLLEPLYNTSITVRDSHTPGDSSHSITAGDSSCSVEDSPAMRAQTSRRGRPRGRARGSTRGVNRGRGKQQPVDSASVTTTSQPSLGNLPTADSPSLLITAGDTNSRQVIYQHPGLQPVIEEVLGCSHVICFP